MLKAYIANNTFILFLKVNLEPSNLVAKSYSRHYLVQQPVPKLLNLLIVRKTEKEPPPMVLKYVISSKLSTAWNQTYTCIYFYIYNLQ